MSGKDTRIVQMQFDNKSFERNIATSQRSLDKFKKELNFEETSKGLKSFLNQTKGLAFDALANNIQKLTDKFTGLGNASEYVLSRIRASLEGLAMQAEQFVKTLTLEQVNVGHSKYDALTKSVQTIVASGQNSEKEAYSVMERVMEYTSQTSHSFETMVSQISSLTSMGIPLGKAERLMEGFANVSTKAGADAGKTAIALQTYAKALGSFLTKDQFNTLNLTARVITKEWRDGMIEAGLATGNLEKDVNGVIRTAKKFGTQMIVTSDNLEDTFMKKWADRKTLRYFGEKYQFGETLEDLRHPEQAMDSLGKTAYLTGQRALTFADAMNAVKDSISSGWMNTFRILFGDLTDAMNLWTGACNKVIDALDGLITTRNEILKSFAFLGGRDNLIKIMFGEMEDTEGNTMYEGAFGLVDMIQGIGDIVSEAFWDVIKNLIPKDQQEALVKEINGYFGTAFSGFDELWNSDWFKEHRGREGFIGSAFTVATEKIGEYAGKIRDYFTTVDEATGLTPIQKIQNVLAAIGRTIAFIFQVVAGISHFWEIMGDDEHLGPTLKIISNLLSDLGLAVIDTENDIAQSGGILKFFESLAEALKPACEIIELVVGSLADLIRSMIKGEEENGTFADALNNFAAVFRKVWGVMMRIARPFAEFIGDIMHILGGLFEGGFDEKSVAEAREKLTAAFAKLWASLKDIFAPLLEGVKQFFISVWERIREAIINYFSDENTFGGRVLSVIKSVVIPVWEWIRNTFTGIIARIRQLYEDAKNGVTLWDMIKVVFAADSIKKITRTLGELVKNGGLSKILFGALGVVAITKIISAFHNISKVFSMLKQFFTDPGSNIMTLIKQGVLGEYEWFSERFLNFANAIIKLVEAVAILGFLDTEKMIQGILGLSAIMLAFAGMWVLIGKSKATWSQQMGLTAAFTALAASLAILVLALTPFMITDWGGMLRAIAGFGAVLLELIGFMLLTSYLPIGVGQLRGFIGFAVSIGILILSLTPLMLTSWEGMLRALVGLGVVLAELLGFMELIKALGVSSYSLNMKGMYKLALSIGILMISLIPFMLTDWNGMLRAVVGLGIVLLELMGFMELIKVLGVSSYSLNTKGMYKFALSVGILMLSLTPFLLSDWEGMLRAVVGLGIVLAELMGFMELIKALGLSAYSLNMKGMYKFALSVAILMLSLIPFMLTNWDGMLRAVTGFGIVLAELIGFMELMKVLGLSGESLKVGGIASLAIGIGILLLALIPFLLTDWSGMFRAVAGLGIVLAELIGFMYIIQNTKFAVRMDKLGGFLAFAISLGVLMLSLTPLLLTDWSGMLRAVTGLGLIMAEMLIFMAIAKKLDMGAKDMAGVIVIALALSVIAVAMSIAMNEVRNIRWEVITAFTTGLATAMLAMAAAIIILSKVPMSDGIRGIALLAAGIVAIVGALALMVPYLISSVGNSLVDMSGKLELVAGLVTGFVGKIGGVDEGQIDAAIGIFEKLRTLMAKVVGWGSYASSLDGFSYAMFVLGTSMEIFNNHVGNVIGDLDGDAQAALKFIQDLSSCAGDLDTIAKMNYDALISRISGLGGALYLFGKGAQEAAGMTAGETPDVTGAMTILREISTALTENGGFTIPSNMPSEDALGTFGAQLAALALALVEFEKAGSGLGAGTAEALRTLDFFADLKDKLIKQEFRKGLGEAIGIFSKNGVDKNQLTEFGANIEQLGLALKQFAQSTTVIDEATGETKELNFDAALKALDAFAELRGKLGFEFGPLIQFFIGRNRELEDLAGEIETMGTAINDVTEKLTYTDKNGDKQKFDKTIFDDAIEVCDKVSDFLIKLRNKLGNVGGIFSIVKTAIVGRAYDFTDLQVQMQAFADSVSAVASAKHEDLITTEELESIYSVLDNVIDYLSTLGSRFGRVGGAWNILKTAITGRTSDFTDLKTQMEAFADSVTAINNMQYSDLISVDKLQDIYPVLDDIVNYLNGENGLSKNLGKVGGAIDAVSTFFTGRTYNSEDLKKDLTAFAEGVSSLTTFNVDADGNTIFSEDGRQATFELLDSMITYMNGLGDRLPKIGGVGEFLNTLVSGRAATFEDLGKQLGHLGEGLGKFYANLTTEAGTGYDSTLLSDSLSSIASMVTILKQMAFMNDLLEDTTITDGFRTDTINNITAYVRKLSLALGYMAEGDRELGYDGIAGSIAKFINDFMGTLDEFSSMEDVRSAGDILNNVTTAIANLVSAAKNAQLENGTTVDFSIIGVNIAKGTAEGIRTGTSEVIQAAIDMATAAITAAQTTLDEESPSRVFMTIGEFISEGAAIGIRNKTGDVSAASDALGQEAVDSAANAMALFAQLMSQDIDANPTITPVVDLSNVTAGSEAISSLLGGSVGMSLAGAGAKAASHMVPYTNKTTSDYNGQDLSGVYNSIQSLGSRIDALGVQISNMQIVLDSGALAGAVTPGVNQNIGNKITYRRRRN